MSEWERKETRLAIRMKASSKKKVIELAQEGGISVTHLIEDLIENVSKKDLKQRKERKEEKLEKLKKVKALITELETVLRSL